MQDKVINKKQNLFSRILAIIGPGLFLIGYNIGTGSVTTMASAGSRWGLSLTWAVLLSCIFTFICIRAFSKYTLVTGETILYAVKTRFRFGKQISFFILCSIIFAEFMGVAGLTVIIVDLFSEWGRQLGVIYKEETAKTVIAAILAGILFAILWRGKYATIEKILSSLVILMGVSFLLTVFFVVPSWDTVCKGLIPGIPDDKNASLIVAGMAGTTLSSAMLFCRSVSLKAKGWGLRNRKNALTDTIVSVTMMFLLSFAVMVCAAGTLYIMGKPVEEAMDMVKTIEPLAGRFASAIFIAGLVGAGVSSLIPTILIAPWLLADYHNRPVSPKSKDSKTFVIIGLLIVLLAPFINTRPVLLMIVTMAVLAVVLPLSTISITVLLNQKILGSHKNSILMNTGCIGAIIFSIIMSYFGIVGLLGHF